MFFYFEQQKLIIYHLFFLQLNPSSHPRPETFLHLKFHFGKKKATSPSFLSLASICIHLQTLVYNEIAS